MAAPSSAASLPTPADPWTRTRKPVERPTRAAWVGFALNSVGVLLLLALPTYFVLGCSGRSWGCGFSAEVEGTLIFILLLLASTLIASRLWLAPAPALLSLPGVLLAATLASLSFDWAALGGYTLLGQDLALSVVAGVAMTLTGAVLVLTEAVRASRRGRVTRKDAA